MGCEPSKAPPPQLRVRTHYPSDENPSLIIVTSPYLDRPDTPSPVIVAGRSPRTSTPSPRVLVSNSNPGWAHSPAASAERTMYTFSRSRTGGLRH